jgi:AraC-like DNA-binding protein
VTTADGASAQYAPARGPALGWTRLAMYRNLPDVVRSFGVDFADALELAGLAPDAFDTPDARLAYPDLGRLLNACERLTGCDHILFEAARRLGLDDTGLAGQLARCSDSAGEALQRLCDHYTLQATASILSLVTSGTYARLAFAVVQEGMGGTGQFQVGAMAVALNVLRELCGPGFVPTVVTFARRSPSNLKSLHAFFRAPLQFDSDESAVVFERHWLDRPLPEVNPRVRREVEAAVRAQRRAVIADLPATVRLLVRKQLVTREVTMDRVARRLGMHRRSLDRHLERHGVSYRQLKESVQSQMACQLLLDTQMQVQHVADALLFSSAANFATAFRRWTGMTPSEYRRRAA